MKRRSLFMLLCSLLFVAGAVYSEPIKFDVPGEKVEMVIDNPNETINVLEVADVIPVPYWLQYYRDNCKSCHANYVSGSKCGGKPVRPLYIDIIDTTLFTNNIIKQIPYIPENRGAIGVPKESKHIKNSKNINFILTG